MITVKQIAAIKAAQRDAGLSDEAYRDLLDRKFGVTTCKDLDEGDVSTAVKLIRAAGGKRKGWKPAQIRKYRQYAKWCGMTPREWGQFLYDTVKIMSEESPYLGQGHFDDAMATIEEELEFRIMNGKAARPEKINLNYWRDRRPEFGRINTREKEKIMTTWNELAGYLPEEKQSISYLLSIAAKAIGRQISQIDKLASKEALKVIEALKYKLNTEKTRLKEEVPF